MTMQNRFQYSVGGWGPKWPLAILILILIIQTLYESWHLQLTFEIIVRSLRLIVWPPEISELTEVKMKKYLRLKLKHQQFFTYRNVIHIKRSLTKVVIKIWNKIKEFWIEKWSILWFSIPQIYNLLWVLARFLRNLQRYLKNDYTY